MNASESSRAVSPVVGVILVVAITVALSGVVGVFVFDIGQSTTEPSQTELGTRITHNSDGTLTIQVVTGTADELRVLVAGVEQKNITLPSPGSSLTVFANPGDTLTVIAQTNDDQTIISSGKVSSSGFISNSPPDASVTADSTLVSEGSTVNFDATGTTDSNGDSLTYDWDFDDGTTATDAGQTPSHTYSSVGTYQAIVTVTDTAGASDSASVTIEVEAGAPTEGLVAHWEFETGSGGTAYDSVNSYDGNIQGASWFNDANRSTVLDFDGGSSHIAISDTTDLRNQRPMTVSAWVNADGFPSGAATLMGDRGSTGNGWQFRYNQEYTRWNFLYADGAGLQQLYGSYTHPTGEWVLITASVDSAGNVDIYANATRIGGGSVGAPVSRTSMKAIGRNGDASAEYWNGQIDDVRFYNSHLNDSEVQDLYKATE